MSTQAAIQSKVTPVNTKTGIDHKDRAELAHRLSSCLANTYLLYLKTQNVHWNIVGPMFYAVHKLTEEQYKNMASAIDDIAERIRAIGFIAPADFDTFKALSGIDQRKLNDDAVSMVEQLVVENEYCAKTLRKAVQEAERLEDVKTADLLTERIGSHEESAWMLRSLIA